MSQFMLRQQSRVARNGVFDRIGKSSEAWQRKFKMVAILFLVFNRPGTTELVMDAIRAARPQRLYVAADGPREAKVGEGERCAEVRRLATDVDWPCELRTLFRERNLGCRDAISSALTWFFEQEAEGIVLEDDCVPDRSFFPYCTELLKRYRDDERVMCITGCNFQNGMGDFPFSYYFSRYNHCWGWASWRRAWRLYDRNMEVYPDFVRAGVLNGLSGLEDFEKYWSDRFNGVTSRRIDTWDYVWTFSCWANNGLTCTPRVNLVSNIGFGPDGTHTLDPASRFANMSVSAIETPLRHPRIIAPYNRFDAHVDREHFGINGEKLRPKGSAAIAAIRGPVRRLRSLAKGLLASGISR